jgi:hypothetical protein
MSLTISPSIRLGLLIGVLFVNFFGLVATINNISSLSSDLSQVENKKNDQKTRKLDYLKVSEKKFREDFTRSVGNETREQVNNKDMIVLQPFDPNQNTIPTVQNISIIPR